MEGTGAAESGASAPVEGAENKLNSEEMLGETPEQEQTRVPLNGWKRQCWDQPAKAGHFTRWEDTRNERASH